MPQLSQRSVPEVLQDIVSNLQEIVRSEFRLAAAEMKEQAAKAVRPAVTLGIGILFAVYALGFVLLSAMYGLTLVVAPWIAALAVGIIVGLPAIILISSGRNKFKQMVVSQKTVKSIKENVEWAKNHLK